MKTALKPATAYPRMAGVTLIELMIALVLGLLVSAAALGVFSSNRETFRSTENMSRLQENARVAFELMSRDIREAGGIPCGNGISPTNNLASADTTWWSPPAAPTPPPPPPAAQRWVNGLHGYNNGALNEPAPGNQSAAGTDAIDVLSAGGTTATVTAAPGATFTATPDLPEVANGALLMACDFTQAVIFSAANVVHVPAPVPCPAPPALCPSTITVDAPSALTLPAIIAPYHPVRWFIQNNGPVAHGNHTHDAWTLNRATPAGNQVIADGILVNPDPGPGEESMRIQYLTTPNTGYVDSTGVVTGVVNWSDVLAVRITLTLKSPDYNQNDAPLLVRTFQHTIALRNRN